MSSFGGSKAQALTWSNFLDNPTEGSILTFLESPDLSIKTLSSSDKLIKVIQYLSTYCLWLISFLLRTHYLIALKILALPGWYRRKVNWCILMSPIITEIYDIFSLRNSQSFSEKSRFGIILSG
jgi:hypothetical protein